MIHHPLSPFKWHAPLGDPSLEPLVCRREKASREGDPAHAEQDEIRGGPGSVFAFRASDFIPIEIHVPVAASGIMAPRRSRLKSACGMGELNCATHGWREPRVVQISPSMLRAMEPSTVNFQNKTAPQGGSEPHCSGSGLQTRGRGGLGPRVHVCSSRLKSKSCSSRVIREGTSHDTCV